MTLARFKFCYELPLLPTVIEMYGLGVGSTRDLNGRTVAPLLPR